MTHGVRSLKAEMRELSCRYNLNYGDIIVITYNNTIAINSLPATPRMVVYNSIVLAVLARTSKIAS
jgi:hypothetical protein